MRFKNGYNKVVIALRVVQFWSEIILVISNRTRAARSFDFEITRPVMTDKSTCCLIWGNLTSVSKPILFVVLFVVKSSLNQVGNAFWGSGTEILANDTFQFPSCKQISFGSLTLKLLFTLFGNSAKLL